VSINITDTKSLTYGPYYHPTNSHFFKLSNDNLVCFYIRYATGGATDRLYYSISTDDGDTWGTSTQLLSGISSYDLIQSGDNFYIGRLPTSTGYGRVYTITYNSGTNTFSVDSGANFTGYGYSGGTRAIKALVFDSKYFFIPRLSNNQNISLFFASSIGGTWTGVASGNIGGTIQVVDAIVMTDRIRVFANYNSKIYQADITATESSYEWSSWSECFSGVLDSVFSVTANYISNTNINVAYRTTTGYKIRNFNGTTWSDAVDISSRQNDTAGQFSNLNGTLVFVYIREHADADKWAIYLRTKKTTWSDEVLLEAYSTSQIHKLMLIKSSSNETLNYSFVIGNSDPYDIEFNTYTLPEGEKIDIEESLLVSESIENKVSQEYLNIEETVHLAENVENDVSNEYFNVNESLEVSDEVFFNTDSLLTINELISISDEIELITNRRVIDIEESLVVSDSNILSNLPTIKYISKILSYNPLVVITNTTPAEFFSIDTSDPDNIIWTKITLSEVNNLIDIEHNSSNEFLYSIDDETNLLKIKDDNYSNRTLIDLNSENSLLDLSLLSNKLKTFITTDDETGELITLEEVEIKSIPLDIRILKEDFRYVPCIVSTVKGKTIPTDIRILKQNTAVIGLDVRVLKYDFSEVSINPLTYDNIDIKINGVSLIPLDDIDMSSVNINHNIENEKSVASFNLHRRFDDLNKTLGGTASVITSNNVVQIYINGYKEFEGKVSNIKTQSESENVSITATGVRPSDKRNNVTVPFSSLNENLHLYDCLISNIDIDNPYVDPEDENPEYYKGVKVDMGQKTEQVVSRWVNFENVIDDINNGTLVTTPNWTYFWFVGWQSMSKTALFGRTLTYTSAVSGYIGTSISPLSHDVIKIHTAQSFEQRIYENTVSELGYYYLGEAPYMEISCQNGVLVTKDKWEDRNDGLYRVKDESYNYLPYVSRVAQIEFNKIKNINGDILPIASCDVSLSLDAYYFYDIKLLKRLNFSNTTLTNIYNNLNGFPVSVKVININLGDMTVNLQCSNQWSSVELEEMEDEKPNESNYITSEQAVLNYDKYDVATGARIF
jgi:hypothetical protein